MTTSQLADPADVVAATSLVIRAEAYAQHAYLLEREPEQFGPGVRARLESGREITATAVAHARRIIGKWRREAVATMGEVDVYATPTTRGPAPHRSSGDIGTATEGLTRLTLPWSAAGTPAISVPCGLAEDGLPVGLQLITAPGEDLRLLRVAVAFQETTRHHLLRPPLAHSPGETV